MRTIEVLIVILIIIGAFIAVTSFAVLPSPKQVSPMNLNRLAVTTLEELDSKYDLSNVAFQITDPTALGGLQVALSASLPPNVIYNLTIYGVNTNPVGATLYDSLASFSNAASLGTASDAASYLVASSNVTYAVTARPISTNGNPITLYILNCSDAAGWWITGYTPSSLAQSVYNLLAQYFSTTIMIQNTTQLYQILNGRPIQGETLNNSVIINTCGEAVPIPSQFNSTNPLGYDTNPSDPYPYSMYCYTLGNITRFYNWTWVSIVGWPFYYVTNTNPSGFLNGSENGWGVYGMKMVASEGLGSFLQGLDKQPYNYATGSSTGQPGVVYLSNLALNLCNYYGLYPSPSQTATRALSTSITSQYNLTVTTYLFNTTFGGSQWNPGAVYLHQWTANGVTSFQGGFCALGMTRIPDIRLVALAILCAYQPVRYSDLYTAAGTTRLVVLQLGLAGGG